MTLFEFAHNYIVLVCLRSMKKKQVVSGLRAMKNISYINIFLGLLACILYLFATPDIDGHMLYSISTSVVQLHAGLAIFFNVLLRIELETKMPPKIPPKEGLDKNTETKKFSVIQNNEMTTNDHTKMMTKKN